MWLFDPLRTSSSCTSKRPKIQVDYEPLVLSPNSRSFPIHCEICQKIRLFRLGDVSSIDLTYHLRGLLRQIWQNSFKRFIEQSTRMYEARPLTCILYVSRCFDRIGH